MCLVLFAYRTVPGHPLVVAANRDELYARDTAPAQYWDDAPAVLAGRDLSAGGTWMGVTRSGRFAAVTNFAEAAPADAPRSRGELTSAFLLGASAGEPYAMAIDGSAYRGFNLLLWDGGDLVHASNHSAPRVLAPGVYGLTNTDFGTPWPKVVRGVAALRSAVTKGPEIEALLSLLGDDVTPPDEQLPERGRGLEAERVLGACFIRGAEYGTRASTAVVVGARTVEFAEQAFGPQGTAGERRDYRFEIEPHPPA